MPAGASRSTLRKGREVIAGAPPLRALLHVVLTPASPELCDKVVLLLVDGTCSIGRNVTAPDVLLDDPCASRLHARVTFVAAVSPSCELRPAALSS